MAASNAANGGWKVADMPSQTGRRAIITGANSGIGYWAAFALARKGAHVVLACRNLEKGGAALARLNAELPGASTELAQLDLASLDSVRAFSAGQLSQPLDLLINNAGVMAPRKRQVTQDGFELQFGTNVLGHFALTALLLPALQNAAAHGEQRPRVVTIASIAHKQGRLNFVDLQSQRRYKPMTAYQQTKLADLMFSFELSRRLQAAASPTNPILSLAAHPGVAETNLFQVGDFHPAEKTVRGWVGVAIGTLLNSESEGAIPTLYAATAPDAVNGGYYGPQGFLEMRGGDVGPAKVARQARDQAAATRLWSECERLTGVTLL